MPTSMFAGLSPQHVHGAGIALMVAAVGGFAYFQARPVVAARAEVRTLTTQLADEREALDQAHLSRKGAEARVGELRGQLAGRLVSLVPRSHLNERLEQLSQMVETSGMTVDRLTPAETATMGPFPSLQLRLVSHGPFRACERLIGSLHTTFPDTAITSVRVKATPENPDEPVAVDVELLWYTAAEPAGAP